MVKNLKQTSENIASLASSVLNDKTASRIAKKLAASALTQRSSTKESGKELEQIAHKVMNGKRYAQRTRTLAASVLAQANKPR